MANVKISALPTWSGTAADLRWFVMNNSGETETFKFSGYTSTISAGNRTRNGMLGGAGNTISGGDYSVMLGGGDQTCTSSFGAVVAGYGNAGNSYCGIVGGYGNVNGGEVNLTHGSQNTTQGKNGSIIAAQGSQLQGDTSTNQYCFIGAGYTNIIATSLRTSILSGEYNTITSSPNSSIIGGTGNTLSGKTSVVMVGCSGRTASISYATFVENLVVFNYASLNYADDTAAAAGGVVLGQIYHNSGALRIRIT